MTGSVTVVAISVPKAAELLGIGRTVCFSEVRSGRLASFQIGRRRLVPVSALKDYVDARAAEAQHDPDAA